MRRRDWQRFFLMLLIAIVAFGTVEILLWSFLRR